MPLLSGLKEIEYRIHNNPPVVSLGYLTHRDANDAISFYTSEMPRRGWILTDKEDHLGSYTVEEWVPMLAPGTTFKPECGLTIAFEIPRLKMHGSTLTFKAAGRKCVITVHTFDDAIELSKNHPYDLTGMEENGNTIIGVIYFK